jgi:hypothetical protein
MAAIKDTLKLDESTYLDEWNSVESNIMYDPVDKRYVDIRGL